MDFSLNSYGSWSARATDLGRKQRKLFVVANHPVCLSESTILFFGEDAAAPPLGASAASEGLVDTTTIFSSRRH